LSSYFHKGSSASGGGKRDIYISRALVPRERNGMDQSTPPSTPSLKPSLHVDAPLRVDSLLTPPSSPILEPVESNGEPVESLRGILRATIERIPDHVISPSLWRVFLDPDVLTPLTLSYFVGETNITVQITGYSNGQYVVRLLLGRQLCGDNECHMMGEIPLVAVSFADYRCDGEWQNLPVRSVREKLIEKVEWDQLLA